MSSPEVARVTRRGDHQDETLRAAAGMERQGELLVEILRRLDQPTG